MRHKLEEYRLEALHRLDQEQAHRESRASDLRSQATDLEAENAAALPRLRRAQETMPADACPQCWIDRGERNPLEAHSDAEGVDFFQCPSCGHTIEAPIRRARHASGGQGQQEQSRGRALAPALG